VDDNLLSSETDEEAGRPKCGTDGSTGNYIIDKKREASEEAEGGARDFTSKPEKTVKA